MRCRERGPTKPVGCRCAASVQLAPRSRIVYPTQAKKRLEWGTHHFLPVHRKFEVVTTRQLSHPLPVPAAKAGCPIQAVFWLEWDNTALIFSCPCGLSRPSGTKLVTRRPGLLSDGA